MKTFLKTISIALAMIILAPALPAAELEALVRTATGSARAEIGGQTRPLAPGDTIPAGAIIVTEGGSQIDFTAVPGTTMRLEGNSRLEIQKLDMRRSGSSANKTAHFRLVEGVVMADIERADGETVDVRVQNDRGTAVAKGTGFRLTQVLLLVGRGLVEFIYDDGTSIEVGLNQLVELAARQAGLREVPPALQDNALLEAFLAQFSRPVDAEVIDENSVLIVFEDGTTQVVDFAEALALLPTNLFGELFALLSDSQALQDILNELDPAGDLEEPGTSNRVQNPSNEPLPEPSPSPSPTVPGGGEPGGPGPGPGPASSPTPTPPISSPTTPDENGQGKAPRIELDAD